jgi:Ca2+-binding RTX toxin-like protein
LRECIMASIVGTNGDDVLTGTEFNDDIQGLGGNDTLAGLGGNDSLKGGAGADSLSGGAGNNFISGGAGFADTVDYSKDPGAVTVNLATHFDPTLQSIVGTATNGFGGTDTLHHIENVNGSPFADSITGDNNANVLNGLGGDDTLIGMAGNDVLNGGTGNDFLDGGRGDDILTGGAGDNFLSGRSAFKDTVDYSQDPGAVKVNLADHFDPSLQSIVGKATNGFGGTDTLHHIENVFGTPFDDTITGDNNDNILNGFGGNDNIKAEAGIDIIILAEAWPSGTGGNLKINGGVGGDTLKLTGFDITLDLLSIPNADLKQVDHIDLGAGGNNSVELNVGSVLSMTDSNTLFIEGDNSDFVTYHDSGWTDTGSGPVGYNQWAHGPSIVNIEDTIPLENIIFS